MYLSMEVKFVGLIKLFKEKVMVPHSSTLAWKIPWTAAPQAPPVPGILQARTLEWVAISFSNAWK